MVTLERIRDDFAMIPSANVECGGGGVNQWSAWKGFVMTLQGLPLTMLILGGQSMVNMERVCDDFARFTSDNVDPGGSIMVNMERIHNDFARFTSDNVDPGGSIDSQHGKDLQ